MTGSGKEYAQRPLLTKGPVPRIADTPLFLLVSPALDSLFPRGALLEKNRDEGIAAREHGCEKAGARKMGIDVDLAEAEEMPRVTAAIVTVVG